METRPEDTSGTEQQKEVSNAVETSIVVPATTGNASDLEKKDAMEEETAAAPSDYPDASLTGVTTFLGMSEDPQSVPPNDAVNVGPLEPSQISQTANVDEKDPPASDQAQNHEIVASGGDGKCDTPVVAEVDQSAGGTGVLKKESDEVPKPPATEVPSPPSSTTESQEKDAAIAGDGMKSAHAPEFAGPSHETSSNQMVNVATVEGKATEVGVVSAEPISDIEPEVAVGDDTANNTMSSPPAAINEPGIEAFSSAPASNVIQSDASSNNEPQQEQHNSSEAVMATSTVDDAQSATPSTSSTMPSTTEQDNAVEATATIGSDFVEGQNASSENTNAEVPQLASVVSVSPVETMATIPDPFDQEATPNIATERNPMDEVIENPATDVQGKEDGKEAPAEAAAVSQSSEGDASQMQQVASTLEYANSNTLQNDPETAKNELEPKKAPRFGSIFGGSADSLASSRSAGEMGPSRVRPGAGGSKLAESMKAESVLETGVEEMLLDGKKERESADVQQTGADGDVTKSDVSDFSTSETSAAPTTSDALSSVSVPPTSASAVESTACQPQTDTNEESGPDPKASDQSEASSATQPETETSLAVAPPVPENLAELAVAQAMAGSGRDITETIAMGVSPSVATAAHQEIDRAKREGSGGGRRSAGKVAPSSVGVGGRNGSGGHRPLQSNGAAMGGGGVVTNLPKNVIPSGAATGARQVPSSVSRIPRLAGGHERRKKQRPASSSVIRQPALTQQPKPSASLGSSSLVDVPLAPGASVLKENSDGSGKLPVISRGTVSQQQYHQPVPPPLPTKQPLSVTRSTKEQTHPHQHRAHPPHPPHHTNIQHDSSQHPLSRSSSPTPAAQNPYYIHSHEEYFSAQSRPIPLYRDPYTASAWKPGPFTASSTLTTMIPTYPFTNPSSPSNCPSHSSPTQHSPTGGAAPLGGSGGTTAWGWGHSWQHHQKHALLRELRVRKEKAMMEACMGLPVASAWASPVTSTFSSHTNGGFARIWAPPESGGGKRRQQTNIVGASTSSSPQPTAFSGADVGPGGSGHQQQQEVHPGQAQLTCHLNPPLLSMDPQALLPTFNSYYPARTTFSLLGRVHWHDVMAGLEKVRLVPVSDGKKAEENPSWRAKTTMVTGTNEGGNSALMAAMKQRRTMPHQVRRVVHPPKDINDN
ncbi:hypothetical protein HK102_008486 [Quaeritorhiza haematococci]|nr:hypothetical protein HK102_008486 [Quaeritorhiza haematococci]